MSTYADLKKRIKDLDTQKTRLTTQLEELIKQEDAELLQLSTLGVVDANKALSETAGQVAELKKSIETTLAELEK